MKIFAESVVNLVHNLRDSLESQSQRRLPLKCFYAIQNFLRVVAIYSDCKVINKTSREIAKRLQMSIRQRQTMT